MPLALIPFLLLVVPVLEIGVFIAVGGAIGLWPTLGLVVLTAVIGSVLLRRQGLSTLEAIQRETRAGRVPGRELVSGLMIAIAGVLLLTPGFVTDTLGFLLFVPQLREAVWRFLRTKVVVVGGQAAADFGRGRGAGRPQQPFQPNGAEPGRRPDVVDLSGDDYRRQPDPSSPWNADNPDDPSNRTLH